MNKQKAKQKANMDSLDFLDDLGSSKEDFKSVESAEETIVASFIERVKNNINEQDLVVTGKMQNIELIRNGDFIEVHAPIHLLFHDQGVNGTEVNRNAPFSYGSKMPPIEVFVEYIKRKGLQSFNNSKFFEDEAFKGLSDDDKIRSIAFAMAKSIQKNGIEAKYIVEKEIPQLKEELAVVLPNVLFQDWRDKYLKNKRKKK